MVPIGNAHDFGAAIRTERKRRGYTQTELAEYSGVGITFISQLERGKETAELGRALRVMATLGMDLEARPRDMQP
ncbi:MAG: helix-turn-helix domain-containing protein [Atopobiaceae bacterium]